MVNSFSSNGKGLFPLRWVDKLLRVDPPHPATFRCGVRVASGRVPGEGSRWKYRRSAVDPLVVDGVVNLTHGTQLLRLRVDPEWQLHDDRTGQHRGYALLRAVEQTEGAHVEIALSLDELERFGVPLP